MEKKNKTNNNQGENECYYEDSNNVKWKYKIYEE